VVIVCADLKLLVFAHTPPPHHGQSYMVQLLLEGLRTDPQFEVYHVNAQLSSDTEEIGRMRPGKVVTLLKYCLQAVWFRVRHGVTNFYYVPANPARAPLYRDWIVMLLCRPFFPRRIFHWHAAGLGHWLQTEARWWERALSRILLGGADLSIVLSEFNRDDAAQLKPRRTEMIPNGIPDPCPTFKSRVFPERLARLPEPKVFQVLYIGLCLREKGLFDAIEGVRMANERYAPSAGVRFKLLVAGSFWIAAERAEFDQLCKKLRFSDGSPQVEYLGFVSGEAKNSLFENCNCLCFPTYYWAESFGLVAVEAMAYGLPVITTRWRMIPEVLPPGYAGLVDPRSPEQIAAKLVDALKWDFFAQLREHYLRHFTVEAFWRKMKAALLPHLSHNGTNQCSSTLT
jgi:glycosyltransferase involved in cell wall biosynthesis